MTTRTTRASLRRLSRKEAAYRLCYGIMTVELAQRCLLAINA
jgi:hypothetical protein